jgi:hypothetical protein
MKSVYTLGWAIWGPIPCDRRFLSNNPDWLHRPPCSQFNAYRGFLPLWLSGWVVKLTIYLYLEQQLRESGAISVSQYAYMAQTETTLPYIFI